MVRLDFDREAFDDLPEIEPLRKVRRRRPRKTFRSKLKLTCLFLFLFFILAFGFIGLAALAKTGILEVPVLSGVFYQIPRPSHKVEISQEDLAKFKNGLQIINTGGQATLIITEKELTYLLRQFLSSGQDPEFANNLQATIDNNEIEIFGLMIKSLKINLTMRIKPEVLDGKLNFKIIEFKAGNLSLPPTIISWLPKRLLSDKLIKLNDNLSQFGRIDKIELASGQMTISGIIDLKK
ncbi:MAG: hypothetical protein M1338_00760 [Patescibacteria group bacterium]|nr:hypothetical protein [Patescibacteria group bacterium]